MDWRLVARIGEGHGLVWSSSEVSAMKVLVVTLMWLRGYDRDEKEHDVESMGHNA
jgi:hypothetical protein